MSTARQHAILDATCAVIARRGIDGLRTKDVAAQANVSTALLHYYFATRADLVVRAFAYAEDRAAAFIDRRIADATDARGRLDAALVGYLEDDPSIDADWLIYAETLRAARFDDELRPTVLDSHRAWIEEVRGYVLEVDPSIARPTAVAGRLAALLTGLAEHVRAGITTSAEARALAREGIALELGERVEAAS